MIVYDIPQRLPEWAALRAGLVTGSCAAAILATRKRGNGELAIRRDLRQRLVVERLTGRPVEGMPYLPKDMQHGIETEPAAFAAYEAETGLVARSTGFIVHDTLKAGCSPDGYVGDWEGVLELKAPSSVVHLDYLQSHVIPDDYLPQLIHTLWMTGAQWCDFVSFDDRFPVGMQLFRKRLARTDVDLAAYELTLRLFLSEVDAAEAEAWRMFY